MRTSTSSLKDSLRKSGSNLNQKNDYNYGGHIHRAPAKRGISAESINNKNTSKLNAQSSKIK